MPIEQEGIDEFEFEEELDDDIFDDFEELDEDDEFDDER